MFDLFGKYAYWKVIKYFALNPSTEVYVNELAKILNLSTGRCSQILRDLSLFGILVKKDLGKAHYYNLNDNYLTNELKRFVGIYQIYDNEIVREIKNTYSDDISVALYGSYSKGDFTEKSDIDILVITQEKPKVDLKDLEEKLKVEINVEKFTVGQWLKLKKDKDPFYSLVMKNHILLHGGELPWISMIALEKDY